MRKLATLFVMLILTAGGAAAQSLKYNYSIDTLSYKLHQSGEWKDLVQLSRKNKDINFYYYNLRVAIACFNRADYRNACKWFKKAESLSPESAEIAGLHYASALYSGDWFDAQRISKLFPQFAFKKSKPLSYVSADAGFSQNAGFNKFKNQDLVTSGKYDATSLITRNFNYQSLYLGHRISPSVSLSEAFGLLTLNKIQLLDYENTMPKLFPVTTKQWQVYISPKIAFNDRFCLSPALSVIGLDIQSAAAQQNMLPDSVLVMQPPKKPYWQVTQKKNPEYSNFSNSNVQYLLSLKAEFKLTNEDLWAEWSKSNFNLQNQFQTRLGIRHFVSPQFYVETSVAFLKNSKSAFLNESQSWIAGFGSGYRWDRLNLDVFFVRGKMNNYSEQNGLILYNGLDPTDLMTGGSVKYQLIANKLMLSGYFRQNRLENKTYVYTNGLFSEEKSYHYSVQSFTGGLTWLF